MVAIPKMADVFMPVSGHVLFRLDLVINVPRSLHQQKGERVIEDV